VQEELVHRKENEGLKEEALGMPEVGIIERKEAEEGYQHLWGYETSTESIQTSKRANEFELMKEDDLHDSTLGC